MIRAASLFFSLLIASYGGAGYAQRDNDSSLPGSSLEIAGQVRTTSGQKTVENVMVRLENFSGGLVDQITTDGTGRFRFSRLRPGQYIVSAKTEGLAARSQQIDLSRFTPRLFVMLQLEPVEETFAKKPGSKTEVLDSRVPEEARQEFEKGRAALKDKKPTEAVAHFESAARIYPAFYEAHVALGDAYMETQKWAQAERPLRRALELKPEASDTLITLGEVYRRQKKYAEAETALVSALKLNRNSWQGHFTLGRVYWETNEVLKAAPHVGQALKLNPDYPEGHLLAGNIFMRLQMPQNALISYEEYLRLAPKGEFAKLTEENVTKLKKTLAVKK